MFGEVRALTTATRYLQETNTVTIQEDSGGILAIILVPRVATSFTVYETDTLYACTQLT
jgi:hypothetical protein